MPAQILHILYGEDVLSRAAAQLQARGGGAGKFLEEAVLLGAFRLGCQGPDLFYHNQRTRPVSLEYGTLLHRRGFGSFSAALLRRTLEPGSFGDAVSSGTAYALGFATHAFLDRACHPYIVSRAGWVAPARPETARYARCHAFFERLLDVLMLERLRGLPSSSWDQAEALVVPCEAAEASIPRLLVAALGETFPERAGKDLRLSARIANAFSDAAYFYRKTDPSRTTYRCRLVEGFEYLATAGGRSAVALMYPERFSLGVDYLNLGHSPWAHPGEGQGDFSLSFPELYQGAVEAGASFFVDLFVALESGGIVPASVAGDLGDGGLSIVDSSGAPCAPRRLTPLPLQGVLDAQYSLRLSWIACRKAAPTR